MKVSPGRYAAAVMAKCPRAGRSKTRLSPPLLPEHAAECSAAFLQDMTQNIASLPADARIDAWAAYAPAGDEALLIPHLAAGTRLVLADGSDVAEPQVEGFGRALLQAVRRLFDVGYEGVLLLNSDSPTLPSRLILEAVEHLRSAPDAAVLGPAEDGGYYLLGLRHPHAEPFRNVTWSTASVAAQTRKQLTSANLRLHELPIWYDVDDAAALKRLQQELAGLNDARAPYTARLLAKLGLLPTPTAAE